MQDLIYKILLFIQPLAGSSLVSLLGGNYNNNTKKWYDNIKQSSLTPPSVVFPIVWTILYLMLGYNGYKIYSVLKGLNRPHYFQQKFLKEYFPIYEAQLILNFSWAFVFFSLQKPIVSLAIVFLMILLTIFLIWKSWKINKQAAFALIPYLFWISFASYLNLYIVVNN